MVYNIEVEGTHTYFAGGVAVHNCHHVVSSTYRRIIDAWPGALVLGFTATPTRLDGRGLGDVFKAMVVGPQNRELIEGGFLAAYDYYAPPTEIDLSGVKTRMGDFALDALSAAVDKSVIIGSAVESYRKYLAPRSAVAFTVSIAHAEHTAAQFREAGFRAASVDGTMTPAQRRELLASVGDGRLHVLTSCSLIAEGVDIPTVGGVILLRPTQSLAVFLQSVGRALRPKPDGSKAVVLDHANNVSRHGLPDVPREWTLDSARKKPREPSLSVCETCFRAFPAGLAPTLAADCPHDPCPMLAPEPAPRAMPEQRDGELVAVTDPFAWTQGIDIARAAGQEWRDLLALADTHEKLRQIARVRKYHHRWILHILRQRHDPAARAA